MWRPLLAGLLVGYNLDGLRCCMLNARPAEVIQISSVLRLTTCLCLHQPAFISILYMSRQYLVLVPSPVLLF